MAPVGDGSSKMDELSLGPKVSSWDLVAPT